MKQSKIQTLLYSSIGVVLVFVALLGFNLIVSPVRARMDLTQEKLHTLSQGTKNILGKLDSEVEIRFYFSRSDTRIPSMLKNYASTVEDMLEEFKTASHGKISIKKLDPEPDSEAEDAAKLDGVEPVALGQASPEPVYCGLALSMDPQKVAIPFLTPEREKLLEYDIARAISQVMETNKAVVGIMSPLPVFGAPSNPMMMRMGQQGQEPWVFINELKRDFDVQQVGIDPESIDPKIKVLLILHPKDISDKAQFLIDQFILGGGKVIALLDPMCMADNRNPNPMGLNLNGGSTLPKLLPTWGINFDSAHVIADRQFSRELQGRDGRPQIVPSFLFVNAKGINKDDAVTSQSDDIWFPFAGAFTGKAADGLQADVLIKSTTDSQLVEGITSQYNGQKVIDDFAASNTNYPIALRLHGKFKTSFPDGRPGDTNHVAGAVLKESKGDGVVYLFGDADFLYDPWCAEMNPFFHVVTPRNGNLALLQNLIEQAAGDANLIGARGRANVRRPFTVVKEMESAARSRYQAKIDSLNKKVEDLQSKLSEMQVKKEGNTSKIILSPEQRDALKKFQEQQIETKKELRRERRNLDVDVKGLENRVKWLNILTMPGLVALAGIALAVTRIKRTNAK
jgi:ABC-type uncharacterized transport system involved in gliding motility auxiliary subunit